MTETLTLPTIDLSSSDRVSIANSIRQACVLHGFFYVINHGIEEEWLKQVFVESRKFFALPVRDKMKLTRSKNHRGYTALYSETLDPSVESKGDLKESFYIGPLEGGLNQWPLEEILPGWRATMELYHEKMMTVGKRLVPLIALSLNLEEDFFEKMEGMNPPMGFLRLLHYPGDLAKSDTGTYGASAHSDYGMITLLATDGVPGLQICREKDKSPRVWEDVPHASGAFVVNVGDMLERWTNCLFRSTLHRVIATGQERYSAAFFFDPNGDCVVECLRSCCSETSPPKFPPIRCGDYYEERFRFTYGSKDD